MNWRTHRGKIEWVRDLLVINLRPGGAPEGTQPVSHLHVYYTTYCPHSGPGHFAYLRLADSAHPDLRRGVTLTDAPAVVDYVRRRFREAGVTEFDLESAAIPAVFGRSIDADRLSMRIEADALLVQARWEGLGVARLSEGASYTYKDEHIWSLVREASDATLMVNGVQATGVNYPDERFRPMYRRMVQSCQVAFGEIVARRVL